VVILAIALFARLAVVAWARGRFPAVEDGHYYDVLARRLAGGHGYTWAWPDGAVTYAAHYPVGYPAMLALAYALFGASEGVAMTLNALLGAASAYAAHSLIDGEGVARWRPIAAGLAVALHPALVPYTAAVMTEGITASLLVIAAAVAGRARAPDGGWPWVLATGVVMAVATFVRPQSLLVAPVLGAFAAGADVRWRSRLTRAAAVSAIALACIAPWTARNCARMHRCALVSVNEGWNLLIGATTTTGAWQPMNVPAECAAVWDEAAKDACFERAAWRDIVGAPEAWLARAPAKLTATLDYFGAAPWYLHASAAGVFRERSKVALATLETVACRLLLLASLVVCGRMRGARPLARKLVAFVGAVGAVSFDRWPHAWTGYAAIVVCVVLGGWRAAAGAPMVLPFTASLVAATVCVHAVFFGAGRYGLVLAPFVAVLAFVGFQGPTDDATGPSQCRRSQARRRETQRAERLPP
jgi:4-amino-4-deoxy-L-arabinose transferase-like glycosyltransferase